MKNILQVARKSFGHPALFGAALFSHNTCSAGLCHSLFAHLCKRSQISRFPVTFSANFIREEDMSYQGHERMFDW